MLNRFGMFVHFGLYASLGYHEQALARQSLDRNAYERLRESFCPDRGAPEEWVLLAKRAGMKYLCFTTKHHDGFCLWDTKTTDYGVMHTPYGRDLLAELADACRRHGVKLSLYYSNPDWHHPNAYNALSSHQWRSVSPELADREAYLAYVRAQITELLTGYGEIYSLFWDIPPQFEDRSMNELVRRLQPGIVINDRGYDEGDFSTPEREIPQGSRFTKMTEACQSVGAVSWGYRENEDYYSVRYLTSSIDHVMAMGGSYLLNVGPMANGHISAPAVEIVERVGEWYRRTEGVLEGNEADPFSYQVSVDDPFDAFVKDGKTYLHFYRGLSCRTLTLLTSPGTPRAVRLQNDGRMLGIRVGCLPRPFDEKTGRELGPFVSITDIPVDAYSGEPIMLEILW